MSYDVSVIIIICILGLTTGLPSNLGAFIRPSREAQRAAEMDVIRKATYHPGDLSPTLTGVSMRSPKLILGLTVRSYDAFEWKTKEPEEPAEASTPLLCLMGKSQVLSFRF